MRLPLLIVTLVLLALAGGRVIAQPAEENTDTLAALVGLIKDSDDPQFQLDILKGMSEALKGRSGIKMPAGWQEVSPKLAKSPNTEVRNLAQSLSTLFGDQASTDKLKATVGDAKAEPQARLTALQALLDAKTAGLAPLLQQWANDPAVRALALRGLAAYDDPKTPDVILKLFPTLRPEEKLAALSTLATREEYAVKLLAALKDGRVARTDVTAATVRQLGQLNNEAITNWIQNTWGALRTTPEDKLQEIGKYKQVIAKAEKAGTKTNATNGRAVFARICAQCHTLFDAGGKVGPDLTGSGRAEADYVLTNVIDPSAVVGKDYQMMIIRLKGKENQKEGRLINGIINREDDNTITVATDTETLTIPKTEILRMKQSEVSMMPEGLLQTFTEQEFLDLLAYLRSPGQVPLPPDFVPPSPATPAQ